MKPRLIALGMFAFAIGCLGQEPLCSLPLNLVHPDFQKLAAPPPEAIVAVKEKQRWPILSLQTNATPRRVLLVLDAGNSIDISDPLSNADLVREAVIARHIVEIARPQDALALVLARGKATQISFGGPRSELLSAINEVAARTKPDHSGKQLLKTIQDSLVLFGKPQLGDAVLIIAGDTYEGSQRRWNHLGQELRNRGIRVFTVATPLSSHETAPDSVIGGPEMGNVVPVYPRPPSPADLSPVTVDTGGYYARLNNWLYTGKPGRPQFWTLDDSTKRQLTTLADNLYSGIAEFYLASAPASLNAARGWKLEPTEKFRNQEPKVVFVYPRDGCLRR